MAVRFVCGVCGHTNHESALPKVGEGCECGNCCAITVCVSRDSKKKLAFTRRKEPGEVMLEPEYFGARVGEV